MTVEVCPGCGERFHCFEDDDHCCTKCLGADEPPTAGPPVAVVATVVKGLDTVAGFVIVCTIVAQAFWA